MGESSDTKSVDGRWRQNLWRIYNRPARPQPWAYSGNLPWDEPEFSARMLREHLDQSHGAASRVMAERQMQLDWLWPKLALAPGQRLLDVTCGPGLYAVALAQRGLTVTGIDFGPAAVAYARELAQAQKVADRCTFIQQNVHDLAEMPPDFDAAMLIYGQLSVMTQAESQTLLNKIGRALRPGGRLCVELLDPARVDKKESTWWYTDEKRLWDDSPFLHLGERFWDEAAQTAVERFLVLHLETGELTEVQLCDRGYSAAEMTQMMRQAGFQTVDVYPAWDGVPLYDASEWLVYVAQK